MGWHGQSLLVCMCVENESSVRPSTRVARTLAEISRPALPSTYKHTPRSFWAHPDGSAVRKRNTRTVIVVAGAVTAAHDPPTRAADASRLSARCHQLSSKPARASEVDFEGSRGVESAPALAQMMNMDPGSGLSCTFGPLYASDRP